MYKRQALHCAAMQGKLEIARLLVGVGADAAKRNKAGKTALELAQTRGKAEVAAFLGDEDQIAKAKAMGKSKKKLKKLLGEL